MMIGRDIYHILQLCVLKKSFAYMLLATGYAVVVWRVTNPLSGPLTLTHRERDWVRQLFFLNCCVICMHAFIVCVCVHYVQCRAVVIRLSKYGRATNLKASQLRC